MKKHDRLEDFIRVHSASFDDLKAPPGVWERIQPVRKQAQVHRIWKWTAIAASALLLVTMGFVFGYTINANPVIAGWDEFREAEQYYQVRIHHQMEKIRHLPVGQEVMNDISLLDEVYDELREQLMNDPNADTQFLLSAMIRHQQQKLSLMENILERVEKYKTNETTHHEM